MAGMQFEYDESGSTFYYFLLAFYVLILIPCTIYFWPSSKSTKTDSGDSCKSQCYCEPCQMKKHQIKNRSPWKRRKRYLLRLLFVALWIGFVLLLYKVSTITMEWKDFDPFAVLNIDKGADGATVRKAYRQLSLKHHPDKGGDPIEFQKIAKAYRALTNEEDRKKWEEYGNPDGPSATHFGIALPKWLVKSENSIIVLGIYTLVFMFVLPIVVGVWWSNASKFTSESVLLETTQLFQYFLHKTPSMMANRIIMILTAAFEFDRGHNTNIIDRPSDNVEIPQLLKQLPQVNEKKKEMPFGAPYSVKARTIFYAHLNRLELNPNTLENNRHMIIAKCPLLIQELVSISGEFTRWAKFQEAKVNYPTLDTIENIMKLSPLVVQALTSTKSPLLQLPHLTEDILRHFSTRKRSIKTVKQLASMDDADRRGLLRSLADDDYKDVLAVCRSMPYITMDINTEVIDDSGSHITANSLVTVTVRLIRESMPVSETVANNDSHDEEDDDLYTPNDTEHVVADGDGEVAIANGGSTVVKTKVWEKNKAQKKKKGKDNWVSKGKKGAAKSVPKPVKPADVSKDVVPVKKADEDSVSGDVEGDGDREDEESLAVVEDKEVTPEIVSQQKEVAVAENSGDESEEDEGWHRLQAEFRKENSLDTKPMTVHQVHCPYFPAEKLEYWWIYVCDRKTHCLVTNPLLVTSLSDEEEIQLKFSAPKKPGSYQFFVCLRSDSYLDMEMNQPLKLDVHEAPVIEENPGQWNFSDPEDDDMGASSDDDSDEEGTDYDVSS